jgi:hypothetical protein
VGNRNAVPRLFSTQKAANARNWTIITIVLVAAACGPIALMASLGSANAARQAVAIVDGREDPIHRPFAEAAAARWAWGGQALPTTSGSQDYGRPAILASEARNMGLDPERVAAPADLGVHQLVWTHVEIVDMPDGRRGEMHRFLVVSDSGMFWLTVPITETDPDPVHNVPQAALGGAPSLEPYLVSPLLDDATSVDWTDELEDVEPSTAATDRMREWADAYATDDHTTLFALTGDERADVTYRGLGGFRVVEFDIGRTAAHPHVTGATMSRVTLLMATSRGVVLRSDYDLLIPNPDAALPNVASWGARGTGPLLAPHEHAAQTGTTGNNGFLPTGQLEARPDLGDDDADPDTPTPDIEAIINDLLAATAETLRDVLHPDRFDVGDIARLVEAADNAPPITIQPDGEVAYHHADIAALDLEATVDGERGEFRVNLQFLDADDDHPWRIIGFDNVTAPRHPLTVGEPVTPED